MRVYNAAITGSSVECEVTAHNSPIAVMAWNQDASFLASASNKGTVLRVHQMPQVHMQHAFAHSTSCSTLGISALCAIYKHDQQEL